MPNAKHLNGRERTALVFCVAFMMATLALAAVDQNSVLNTARSFIDPNYDDVPYTGTIVVPTRDMGQCRFTEFNNRTIEFTRSKLAECYLRGELYSPTARMNSLRDAFKH